MIKLLELGFWDWKYISVLEIETYNWNGSLLMIGTDSEEWQFDLFYLRQLYYKLKDKSKSV